MAAGANSRPESSTSSGGGLTQEGFQEMIREAWPSSVPALTSRHISDLAMILDARSEVGDVIEGREVNRWHNIMQAFRRSASGEWRYLRYDADTAEVYEQRDVDSRYVAQSILSIERTESKIDWRIRKVK